MPAPRATSIHLFLADGTSDGLWVATKENWTGEALVVPRSIYRRIRADSEQLERVGAYVLVGPSETNPERVRVYIGEAGRLRNRLDIHHANKDFWTRVVAFTAVDGSLNMARAHYLESRLVELARTADRAEVENRNVPRRPALTEAERAATESFLEDMLLVYPVIGVTAFEPLPTIAPGEPLLFAQGPGANARGRDTPEGFVVLAESVARLDPVPSLGTVARQRRETLTDEGVLEVSPDGLRFTRDYLFTSPTQAARVVLGKPANGRTSWKDDDGRTLKAIQGGEVVEGHG